MLRSGIFVSLFTLLSKISGLLREQVIAYVFGSSKAADCINVALKFPNLFRRILGEGALASVFVPMYSQKIRSSKKHANAFASQIFTLLICVSVPLTIAMQIFTPQIIYFLAPGFYGSESKFPLCILMCRITMPYLIFITLSALLGGILNAFRHFLFFIISPIIFNAIIIFVCFFKTAMHYPVRIAWSILLAGILQFFFMYYIAMKYNLNCGITKKIMSDDSRFLLKQMIPATMSFGVTQISMFISLSLASFIEGAISIISYAERVYQLPLALIGTSFSTLLLPELSKFYGIRAFKKASNILESSMKIGLIIAIPASIGLGCVADFITCILYQRGQFYAIDTVITAQCLLALSVGLPASILNKILTPVFYASGDVKTPFRITICSVVANILCSITLMKFYGLLGIAMASSISAWINTFLLLFLTHQNGYLLFSKALQGFLIKLLLANLIMLSVIFISKILILDLFYQSGLMIKILILTSIIFFSVIIYFSLSIVFGIVKKKDFYKFKKRYIS